jgi:hypothetical protein
VLADGLQAGGQPERRPHCGLKLAGLDVRLVSTLESAQDLVALAEEARRHGEEDEVVAPEGPGLVRRRQRLVGIRPRAPLVERSSALERPRRGARNAFLRPKLRRCGWLTLHR